MAAVGAAEAAEKCAPVAKPFGLDLKCKLGEGALWDETLFNGRGGLLHIDIIGCRLMVLDSTASPPVNYSFPMPSRIGTVVPCSTPGMVVVALTDGIYSMKLDIPAKTEPAVAPGDSVKTVELPEPSLERVARDPEPGIPTNRLNDGKCDPYGRLWVGSMKSESPRDRTGALYMFDPSTASKAGEGASLPAMSRVLDKVGVSNGVAWSSSGDKMFYIDSFERRVSVFDYDPKTGAASGRKTAFEFAEADGTPDGCVMDASDRLWVAHFNGGQVTCTDTKSCKRVLSIAIPGATQVTSVTLGGPSGSDLFVTTAREDMSEEDIVKFPESGTLFVVEGVGAKGKPAARLQL